MDLSRVQMSVENVWIGTPCHVTHDLEIALVDFNSAAVLVLSGTGSCCLGKAADGRTAKMGGWGLILGDKASGLEIGLRALKACVFYFDRDGTPAEKARRDIRSGYGITLDDACSRHWFESFGNKVVILESEKISMERYNELRSFDESKLKEITRHHNLGICLLYTSPRPRD